MCFLCIFSDVLLWFRSVMFMSVRRCVDVCVCGCGCGCVCVCFMMQCNPIQSNAMQCMYVSSALKSFLHSFEAHIRILVCFICSGVTRTRNKIAFLNGSASFWFCAVLTRVLWRPLWGSILAGLESLDEEFHWDFIGQVSFWSSRPGET